MTEQTAGDMAPIAVSGTEAKNQPCVEGIPTGNETKQETALYVATNLESWETVTPHYYALDISIDKTCFRRLDPDYYAWLKYKMTLVKKAADSGRLSSSVFETLRTRFNVIHTWGIEHYGEDELLSAVRLLDPKTYSPPVLETFGQDNRPPPVQPAPEKTAPPVPQYLFPKEGEWQFTQEVSPSAVAKVDAIRDKALSLGWSEARLYQNREDVFVFLMVRTTVWCVLWMAMCVSAKSPGNQSRLSERHRKRTV